MKHEVNMFDQERKLAAIVKGNWTMERSLAFVSKLMDHFRNDRKLLLRASYSELLAVPGMTESKADLLFNLFSWKASDYSGPTPQQVTESADAYTIVGPMLADLEYECMALIVMNNLNKVRSTCIVSQGGTSATIVDTGIILREVLLQRGNKFILAHNHPSGSLRPSHADIELTKKIESAARMHDITFQDHLITADGGYFSFIDEGLLPYDQ